MSRKKIAFNGYFWDKPHTGSGQYLRQLIYHLNMMVSDLDLVLIYPQLAGGKEPELLPVDVQLKIVPMKEGHWGKLLFEQRDFPRAAVEIGADLAHVPYFGGPLQIGMPLVVTVHDLTTLQVPEYRKGIKSRIYNGLVSAAARGANHIITDSFSSKIDIIDLLEIPEERVTAIYLGVGGQYAVGENSLLDMAVLRKYDLPDFYFLYLGGYEIHKNVTRLLFAFSYVAQALGEDYPLLLAGKKPTAGGVYPDYDSYIEKLGIKEHVRWIGYVDEEDKSVLYRNADCFVFPSKYEGFGLPPLEAMACGVPVVTTDAGSLPEVVGDAAFTVNPDDERDMAGAMIATILQEHLVAELKQKGSQQAAKFSWEKMAEQTLKVYIQLFAGGGE